MRRGPCWTFTQQCCRQAFSHTGHPSQLQTFTVTATSTARQVSTLTTVLGTTGRLHPRALDCSRKPTNLPRPIPFQSACACTSVALSMAKLRDVFSHSRRSKARPRKPSVWCCDAELKYWRRSTLTSSRPGASESASFLLLLAVTQTIRHKYCVYGLKLARG